jgi:hypothetical protein
MYDLLDIFLSVVVFLSPHDVKAVQMWPYAADPNSQKRGLSLTWRKDGNRWICENWDTITITNGKMMGENGKVLLTIKNHLKVTNGTNYVLTQKSWDTPQKFSMSENQDERMIVVSNGTNINRQIRVKLWKTDPPVEFAFSRPNHLGDLILLQKRLQAEHIRCSMPVSDLGTASFSVDSKDFTRARNAAIKIISENSLTVNVEAVANGSGYEVFEKGKKVSEVHF